MHHNTPASPREETRAAELAGELRDRLGGERDGRLVVAVVGEPGSGKSTLVARVVKSLSALGVTAAILPMDGFHLSNRVLEALGRSERKGAIDTFDAGGFVSLLRRVVAGEPRTIYVPAFEHGFGEPIAGAIPIEPDAQVVLAEGNYLLDPAEPWREIRDLVDQTWYVDIDSALRRERLRQRHIAAGKDADFAARWVDDVDERNAERIRGSRQYADRIITVT